MKQMIKNTVLLLCLAVGAAVIALTVEAGFLWVIGQELGRTAESWFGHIIAIVFGLALLWGFMKDAKRLSARRKARIEAEKLADQPIF